MKEIGVLLLVLVMMSSCSPKEKVNVGVVEDNPSIKTNESEIEKTDDGLISKNDESMSKNEAKEERPIINNSKANEFNQDAYIRTVFSKYGYDVPERSQWIVKEEGGGKVVVIIKENLRGPGKPDISKLIFIKNSKTPEVLHLMIRGEIII